MELSFLKKFYSFVVSTLLVSQMYSSIIEKNILFLLHFLDPCCFQNIKTVLIVRFITIITYKG